MRGQHGAQPPESRYVAPVPAQHIKLSPFGDYLRERQAAAHPAWIPATVLQREIAAQGYAGELSQLRAFLRGLRPVLPMDAVVRFETAPVSPITSVGRNHQCLKQRGSAAQLQLKRWM
jgi:transposase